MRKNPKIATPKVDDSTRREPIRTGDDATGIMPQADSPQANLRVARFIRLIPFFLVINSGCSVFQEIESREATVYRSRLGAAWVNHVVERIPMILRDRYGYDFRLIQSDESQFYLETEWLLRVASADERAQGASHARTMVIIEAQHRGRASPTRMTVLRTSVSLDVHYAVLLEPQQQWIGVPLGETMKAYVARLENDLRTFLEIQK